MITTLEGYNLSAHGVEETHLKFEKSEAQRVKDAARRACGVIRTHFGGSLVADVNPMTNTHLQDVLEARVDDLLPYLHNDDEELGTKRAVVRSRVLEGLKLLAKTGHGRMRLVGGFCSLTGKFVVKLVEGLKLRKRRKSQDDWYPEKQRRKRMATAKLQRQIEHVSVHARAA